MSAQTQPWMLIHRAAVLDTAPTLSLQHAEQVLRLIDSRYEEIRGEQVISMDEWLQLETAVRWLSRRLS